MTTFLTALAQLLPQAVPSVLVGLFLWWQMVAMEARQEKRMDRMEDHLREDMKELRGLFAKALAPDPITAS